ncbi:hypothetical protein ACOSP7_009525 [Xanthoceras sorbifolium]|uniref:Prolamin-like domain-containing protein n=1 Tax=Xanthoceras sorbifolium TaxID=99658 RepID=A0ABQ8HUQ5_9ROSI|nr:hypothetical protein JRO89_XS07G0230900 [Xanthoceras sorbifolium]
MAIISKLFLLTLLSALIMVGSMTDARPLHPSSSLVTRLKLDDESLNCWDSLIQLQSCSGEIILFFLNGETYLGSSCCQAIETISQQCWPNMIDTLGFTTEEGDILEGYCDHETTDDHTLSLPSPPSVLPTKVTAKMKALVP